jgi:DNA sulfur modification protein DndD
MPEIYIDSLRIKDFGPYYDEHRFDFSAVDGRRPILIGGRNAAGKTHLLRALYLAVVGDSGAVDLKKIESGSEATKFDLAESLNRRARAEGRDTSELELTLTQLDESGSIRRSLTLIRQIRHRSSSSPIFNSKANLSGDTRWIEDIEKLQKFRDAFLPRHLARFFFFDAERGQSIQLSEREITEGITRVLGLFSYSELEEDLRNLISQKIPKTFGAGSDNERRLNDIQGEILRSDKNLQTLTDELEDKNRELRDVEMELADIETQLSSLGAVDPEQIEKARRQREDIRSIKDRLENNLEGAWEISLPITLLGKFRADLHDYLQTEERRRDWENRKSSVEPRIPRVKKEVFEGAPSEFILPESVLSYYEDQLEKALRGLFHPPEEGMSESVFVIPDRNELSIQVRQKLKIRSDAVKGLAELCADLDRKGSELRELDQKIKQLQSDGAAVSRGNDLRERRGTLLSEKTGIERRIKDIHAERTQIDNKLRELRRQEDLLLKTVDKIRKGRDLNSLAHKYREAVSEIKNRAAIRLRNQISDIVGGLWLDITDRGLEYAALQFDQHWNCSLKRRDGSEVPWETANASAGQKQVRILAFTEALRRLARIVPPLVVDTPPCPLR